MRGAASDGRDPAARVTAPRTPVSRHALGLTAWGDPPMSRVLSGALAHAGRLERATHGFHTYPAGLHPDAARDIIAALPGSSVLDPFCGGGTVLVEAMLAGRAAEGRDVSPVARLVAMARTARTTEASRTALRSTARALTEQARHARDLPPQRILDAVGGWYEPHVLVELESLRAGVADAEESVRPLLRAVLSSILVKASQRRSDTSAQRDLRPRPPGTTAILFHKKARELGRLLEAFEAVLPPDTPPAQIRERDARTAMGEGRVDLVLTSPPYPGTYDYLPLQALREAWLGLRGQRDLEIGPRRAWRDDVGRARADWAEDTRRWMASAARALRPGGHLAVVVGDGHDARGVLDTRAATDAFAAAAGLVPVAGATAARDDLGRGVPVAEHALVYRRALDASGADR